MDALLGTGARGVLRPPIRALVERLNDLAVPILAIDGPTGVDLGTGASHGVLVRAALLTDAPSGRNVLIVAHGNSLRALVKMLDGMSDADIVELNIPTGVPLLYELDAALAPIASRYLGDAEAIRAAAEAVRRQTERKP